MAELTKLNNPWTIKDIGNCWREFPASEWETRKAKYAKPAAVPWGREEWEAAVKVRHAINRDVHAVLDVWATEVFVSSFRLMTFAAANETFRQLDGSKCERKVTK